MMKTVIIQARDKCRRKRKVNVNASRLDFTYLPVCKEFLIITYVGNLKRYEFRELSG